MWSWMLSKLTVYCFLRWKILTKSCTVNYVCTQPGIKHPNWINQWSVKIICADNANLNSVLWLLVICVLVCQGQCEDSGTCKCGCCWLWLREPPCSRAALLQHLHCSVRVPHVQSLRQCDAAELSAVIQVWNINVFSGLWESVSAWICVHVMECVGV